MVPAAAVQENQQRALSMSASVALGTTTVVRSVVPTAWLWIVTTVTWAPRGSARPMLRTLSTAQGTTTSANSSEPTIAAVATLRRRRI